MHTVARGERIVRKGFIISEADFAKLQATRTALSRADWGRLAGNLGLFMILVNAGKSFIAEPSRRLLLSKNVSFQLSVEALTAIPVSPTLIFGVNERSSRR